MCSATLEFLKSNKLSDLISVGVYPKLTACKRFVNLDYDQIEAKNGHVLVEECRGLVLRKKNHEVFNEDFSDSGEFIVCARPMKRFYHYDSGFAPKLDIESSYVMEKLDGSCIKVWWNNIDNVFNIGTRGTAIADVNIGGMHKESSHTFTTLFQEIVGNWEEFCSTLDKSKTYVFELCSLSNQVVVAYYEPFISLLAVIETATGKEENIWDLPPSKFYKPVKRFNLSSKEEMFDFLLNQDPSKFEGFVLMDKSFNRAKCKHPGYDNLNGLKNALSSYRNVLSLILLGKIDDILPILHGEMLEECLKQQEKMRVFINENEKIWSENKGKFSTRKDFAIWCQKNKLDISFYSKLYENKVSTFKDAVVESGKGPDKSYIPSFLDKLYSTLNPK